jgi:hypothetical protein
MHRRVAALVAAPVGGYAVLLLISLLGGPRIGAPFIPLPGGGGGVEAAAPVAGPLSPGEAGDTLPPIPRGETPVPSSPPQSSGPLDEAGQPGQPGQSCPPGSDDPGEICRPSATNGSVGGRPSETASRAGDPFTGEPTPGVAERRLPSMPPATKTPPVPPTATPPGVTPSGPPTVTPTGPPQRPRPTTIAEALIALLETLRP